MVWRKYPNSAGIIAIYLNSWAYGLSSLIDWMEGISPVQQIVCYQLLISYHNRIILLRIAIQHMSLILTIKSFETVRNNDGENTLIMVGQQITQEAQLLLGWTALFVTFK